MTHPSPSAKPSMRVRLIKAGKVVRSFIVKKDTFTIGSGAEASVRIGGIPDLAPKHALIWLDEGVPTLVPSSGCSVLVNGEPVSHTQLGPNDTVSLGRLDLRIESLISPAEPAAPAMTLNSAFIDDDDEEEKTRVAAPPPSRLAALRQASNDFGEDEHTIPSQTIPTGLRTDSTDLERPFDGDDEVASPPSNLLEPLGSTAPPGVPTPAPVSADSWGDLDATQDDIVRPPLAPSPPPQASPPQASPPQPALAPPVAPSPRPPAAAEPSTAVEPAPPAFEEESPTIDEPFRENLEGPGALPASAPAAAEPPPPSAPFGAQPPDQAYDDWEDDWDDEDEEDFVEPFSLVDHLAAEGPPQGGRRERFVAAEVVRYSEGRLWNVTLVQPGQSYRPEAGAAPLVEMKGKGQCLVTAPAEAEGTVWLGGQETALSSRPPEADGRRKLTLSEGDRALVKSGERAHLIQVLRPPKKTNPGFFKAVASLSTLLFFVLGVTLSLAAAVAVLSEYSPPPEEAVVEEEHFEEVTMNDLALIATQVDDVVEVEEDEPEVEEENEADMEAEDMEHDRRPRTRRRRFRGGGGGGGSAAQRLLAKLSGGGGGQGSGASLQDVITNLDSVGSPTSASGLFRSTGFLSSLPGGEVKIARAGGGGGGVNTIGGGELSKSSPGLGRVQGSGGKRGKVRGRVSRVSTQARVRGQLDRSQVLRVINGATGRIQRCYERRLVNNPELSGRIVFGWTIATSGRVAGVAVQSSTVADPAVAGCIARVIRRLRFPQPEGGSVQVSFPFLFRAVAF